MKLIRWVSGYRGNILALAAGASLTLAFAPFHLWPQAIFAPAILLYLWLRSSPSRAFLLGWLFGLGFFSTGVYWVFNSIHTFGNASLLLSCIITGGFIAFLALFPAVTGFLLKRSFTEENSIKMLLAFPALWVLVEILRSKIFTGFPWLLIGYSQVDTPLHGYASILSVYGVSLMTILSSGLIVNALLQYSQKNKWQGRINLIALISIWVIGAILSTLTWTTPMGNPIQVSLVQGNIAQDIKWSPENIQPTLTKYEKLTQPHWDSKIIIWPEAAIPTTIQDAAEFVQKMSDQAEKHNATLITGAPIKVVDNEGYYNAVISLGKEQGVYLKRLLVPFGEFTPFKKWMDKLLGSLNIPMSDFIPGAIIQRPINADGIKIGVFICYEIAFAEQALNHDKGIGLLLTVTNDAWFGHSIAQDQHLQIAQMRAQETGRPLLFVANTGVTAIIKANGQIQSAVVPFITDTLTGNVQPRTGQTPWQRTSLDPMFITLALMLFLARQMAKRRARKQE
ncbi:MAG: apolipoprotein N-acyltransferase [Gammaproteobacteria bacterium]|nr:apolipoprotein N-acyltransferase [Gammaproteobacteria bacterium]